MFENLKKCLISVSRMGGTSSKNDQEDNGQVTMQVTIPKDVAETVRGITKCIWEFEIF